MEMSIYIYYTLYIYMIYDVYVYLNVNHGCSVCPDALKACEK